MKKVWAVVGVLVVLVLAAGGYFVSQKNRLVAADEQVKQSWSQVQNVLQRRADLIPNLVNTVKGYAKQEQEVFTRIADARAQLGGARTPGDAARANGELDSALSRLLVVAERYPELKSNQNFQSLQDELAGSENRIAIERQRYNEVLRDYNVLVRRYPTSVIAGMSGFAPKDDYFEAAPASQSVPTVQF
jgi:LemA protein